MPGFPAALGHQPRHRLSAITATPAPAEAKPVAPPVGRAIADHDAPRTQHQRADASRVSVPHGRSRPLATNLAAVTRLVDLHGDCIDAAHQDERVAGTDRITLPLPSGADQR